MISVAFGVKIDIVLDLRSFRLPLTTIAARDSTAQAHYKRGQYRSLDFTLWMLTSILINIEIVISLPCLKQALHNCTPAIEAFNLRPCTTE